MCHIVHIFFTLIISCTDGELTYFILPQYNYFYGQHITEGVEEFYQIQNSTPWHSVQYPVEVYTFKHLRIRESDGEEIGRILDTTLHPIQTLITQAENLSKEQRCAFNDVALLEADGENHQYMELNIDNIDSIEELSHFKPCPKCRKKIQQDNSSLIAKCDHCGSTFRSSSCEIVTLVKFLSGISKEAVTKPKNLVALRCSKMY